MGCGCDCVVGGGVGDRYYGYVYLCGFVGFVCVVVCGG